MNIVFHLCLENKILKKKHFRCVKVVPFTHGISVYVANLWRAVEDFGGSLFSDNTPLCRTLPHMQDNTAVVSRILTNDLPPFQNQDILICQI